MKVFLFLFLLLYLTGIQSLRAQTLFEDAAGNTSINWPIGGITRLNTTDRSVKLGYYYNRSDRDVVFGIDASGKANSGFASLISNDKLSPEADVNLNLGFKNVSTDDSNLSGYDYLDIKIGIGEAKYWLLDGNSSYENQIYSETFTNVRAGISYNYLLHGNMVFGAYVGYDRTSNISYLNQVTIKETTTIGTDHAGTTVRTTESEYAVWAGSFKKINQFSFYLDYVYLPDFLSNRVALSVYSRSFFNVIQNVTNGGFGVYLNREGDPMKVVGGLIYQFDDLFNAGDSDTSLGKRGTLGLIVGYNF